MSKVQDRLKHFLKISAQGALEKNRIIATLNQMKVVGDKLKATISEIEVRLSAIQSQKFEAKSNQETNKVRQLERVEAQIKAELAAENKKLGTLRLNAEELKRNLERIVGSGTDESKLKAKDSVKNTESDTRMRKCLQSFIYLPDDIRAETIEWVSKNGNAVLNERIQYLEDFVRSEQMSNEAVNNLENEIEAAKKNKEDTSGLETKLSWLRFAINADPDPFNTGFKRPVKVKPESEEKRKAREEAALALEEQKKKDKEADEARSAREVEEKNRAAIEAKKSLEAKVKKYEKNPKNLTIQEDLMPLIDGVPEAKEAVRAALKYDHIQLCVTEVKENMIALILGKKTLDQFVYDVNLVREHCETVDKTEEEMRLKEEQEEAAKANKPAELVPFSLEDAVKEPVVRKKKLKDVPKIWLDYVEKNKGEMEIGIITKEEIDKIVAKARTAATELQGIKNLPHLKEEEMNELTHDLKENKYQEVVNHELKRRGLPSMYQIIPVVIPTEPDKKKSGRKAPAVLALNTDKLTPWTISPDAKAEYLEIIETAKKQGANKGLAPDKVSEAISKLLEERGFYPLKTEGAKYKEFFESAKKQVGFLGKKEIQKIEKSLLDIDGKLQKTEQPEETLALYKSIVDLIGGSFGANFEYASDEFKKTLAKAKQSIASNKLASAKEDCKEVASSGIPEIERAQKKAVNKAMEAYGCYPPYEKVFGTMSIAYLMFKASKEYGSVPLANFGGYTTLFDFGDKEDRQNKNGMSYLGAYNDAKKTQEPVLSAIKDLKKTKGEQIKKKQGKGIEIKDIDTKADNLKKEIDDIVIKGRSLPDGNEKNKLRKLYQSKKDDLTKLNNDRKKVVSEIEEIDEQIEETNANIGITTQKFENNMDKDMSLKGFYPPYKPALGDITFGTMIEEGLNPKYKPPQDQEKRLQTPKDNLNLWMQAYNNAMKASGISGRPKTVEQVREINKHMRSNGYVGAFSNSPDEGLWIYSAQPGLR